MPNPAKHKYPVSDGDGQKQEGARDRIASIVLPVSYAVWAPRREHQPGLRLGRTTKQVSLLVLVLVLVMLAYAGASLKQAF